MYELVYVYENGQTESIGLFHSKEDAQPHIDAKYPEVVDIRLNWVTVAE